MAQIEINEARIRAEFDELARIDSESFRGNADGGSLEGKARRAGNQAKEDDTAEKIGGNAGKSVWNVKGRDVWHADPAVRAYGHGRSGIGKKPVFHEDGTITSMEPPCLARTI